MEIMTSPGGQCPCEILKNESGKIVTVAPPGFDCPCRIQNKEKDGIIFLGDENLHPLTAGEEYFIVIRTFSFYGLQSTPWMILQPTMTKEIVATNNRIESSGSGLVAIFDIQIGPGGLGSHIELEITGSETKYEEITLPFRYHFLFAEKMNRKKTAVISSLSTQKSL